MLPEKTKFRGRTYRKYKICSTPKKAKLWAGDLRNYSKDGSKFGALSELLHYYGCSFLLHRIPTGFSTSFEIGQFLPYYVSFLTQIGFTYDRDRKIIGNTTNSPVGGQYA